MPPKRNRVQGGNARSRASAVPQGVRQRRARPESEDVTDQPAATHIRVEEARQPQWTMNSTVKDILLEGSTLSTNMKLNDFLRNYVGGRAAVDEDSNVTMEVFVRRPNAYVQDQQLLEEILNLTAYQMYKLHHEGVHFLEQWRDYEGKDTVAPLARRKLNGVLTQVLREEHREEVERARREGQVGFTLTTTIEGVLFKGRVRVIDTKLNDFLTMELDGRGILRDNRNVLLRDFFKEPASYIRDAEVLNEIQKQYYALKLESTVREEMELEEDVHQLQEKGVDNLFGWSRAAAEVKASVRDKIKNSLDTAFEVARDLTTKIEAIKMEGLYESVYNARWHHVVEVPDGEGTGMEVKEGKPKQPWTYKEVGDTLEKDDAVQKSDEAPPRLMVLTSDKGWLYTLHAPHGAGIDLCVNCEVDRVWQIVRNDLTKWFSNFYLSLNPSPLLRVLIGTPGIGKSMNAGSYLLYQLLHYDIKKLQVVVHCFGETAYVFDKTAKTVTIYEGNKTSKNVLRDLRQRGMKGYIIYDVTEIGTQPDTGFAPSSGWGMIVVSSPKVSNYDKWERQLHAARIIMNCPDETDVKAMCAWMKRGLDKNKQAEYWRKVEEHMKSVGPIPRHIFDASEYEKRWNDVVRTLNWINLGDQGKYFTQGGEKKKWYSEDPSHKLVKIVRVRENGPLEDLSNAPICEYLGVLTLSRLAKVLSANDILFLVLGMKNALQSELLERYSLTVFLRVEFVTSMVKDLKELPPPSPSKPRFSVLTLNPHGHPTEAAAINELRFIGSPEKLNYRVLYIPTFPTFPLVDGFFFMESPRRTLVGLQMTKASAHHTKTSTVNQFTGASIEVF
ncbi:putative retrotransposon hot spot (RHS) protein [Trypanosoma cruzi]|uniref:Putative retrotransposon hot spot (RHS) protein n=1 Tax=Trypanosoma cruzi TaxID=5693 RepID=A0A2V2V0T6_TRYCR|nr:putative retrotransposon hot spot (RHS) protein [Trypanosoma cruzi]